MSLWLVVDWHVQEEACIFMVSTCCLSCLASVWASLRLSLIGTASRCLSFAFLPAVQALHGPPAQGEDMVRNRSVL